MSKYLCMGGYSPEAWTLMVDNPSDRAAAVRKVCEDAGGSARHLLLELRAGRLGVHL